MVNCSQKAIKKDWQCLKIFTQFMKCMVWNFEENTMQLLSTLPTLVSLVQDLLGVVQLIYISYRCLLLFTFWIGKGVYGVVYYAGHGYEDDGENYLLPVDSDLTYKRQDSLRTQEIVDAMQQCDTSLNLLIIDACRVRLVDSLWSAFHLCDLRQAPCNVILNHWKRN